FNNIKLVGQFKSLTQCDISATCEPFHLAIVGGELTTTGEFTSFEMHIAEIRAAVLPIWQFPFVTENTRPETAKNVARQQERNTESVTDDRLYDKILKAAGAGALSSDRLAGSRLRNCEPPLIVIGASTGGVEALHRVLADFPPNCPATLVVQHMKGAFIGRFAERLNSACKPEVLQAWDGAPLKNGRIYVAPGDTHHMSVSGREILAVRLSAASPNSGHRPSVDRLFLSASQYRTRVVGVLLTGMGKDGANGLLRIRQLHGHTIAQDQKTSTVYGMPRAAAAIGAVSQQLPIDRIGAAALKAARRSEGALN
ncbi:MAG: CheB methylesterase domain-containing protein, partial [Halocynthiibacter sp.]